MIFEIRQAVKKVLKLIAPMWESLYQVYVGIQLLLKVRRQFGEDVHIFFGRGATGDTYIQLILINDWVQEHNCTSYVYVGDGTGIVGLKELFSHINFFLISGYRADCIEKVVMLIGEDKLNLTVMFPWTYSLYINRCRIRMTDKFNFMDTYRWYVFNFNKPIKLEQPVFPIVEDTIYKNLGIKKGKTVIIAPEANSVTLLECEFWNDIIDVLQRKGYMVFINSKQNSLYHAKNIFIQYKESKSLLEYAGCFVGIRSGLCDIISSAKCKKVIIYPKKSSVINYSEHRSEIEFCGLKVMGLIDGDSELKEIETPLIRNVTQKDNLINTRQEYELEKEKLKIKILENFYDF